MEYQRRKVRREKRVDPNPMIGKIILNNPSKNLGITTRSSILKGTKRKIRRRTKKIRILIMTKKNILKKMMGCLYCSFANLCMLECMVDRLWSLLLYEFSSTLVLNA